MVPPTLFISGGIAVLQLCKEIYVRFRSVKRFREDCYKLAHFVNRIEGFISETEEDADMTGPGWQAAFSSLHESLLEVVEVFDDCAKYGMIRSMINADEMNLRLSSIAQRLTLSLQLIPIQKAKVTDKRVAEMAEIQMEIKKATFAASRLAEQQSAQLKRLIDQSRVDATKTQEMLAQVLVLLQGGPDARLPSAAKAAAGPGPSAGGAGAPPLPAQQQPAVLTINPTLLEEEVLDLQAEKQLAQRDKKILEEQYLEQIIAVITAMEAAVQQNPAQEDVPVDLRCPITYQLLQDPVILIESHQTYERAAIQEWLDRGNMKDPITGMQLTSAVLVPNVLVRKLAEEWLDAHPEYKQQLEESKAAAQQEESQQLQANSTPAATAQAAAAALAAKCEIRVQASEPGGQQQGLAGDDEYEEFQLNPKAEASLAAAKVAAAGHAGFGIPLYFEPPTKQHSGKLQQQQQSLQHDGRGDARGLDEKAAAQRAYAAAVAAAAEGQQAEVPVAYTAVAADHRLEGSSAAFDRSDSWETGSSITFARNISRANNDDAAISIGSAVPAGRGSEMSPHFSGDTQQQQQQQQPDLSPSRLLRVQDPLHGFVPAGNGNRGHRAEHRAVAAAAAAAAIQHGQRPGASVTLQDLHTTLGRAAETRMRMSERHGPRDGQEVVKVVHQTSRQQQQQQQEQAYLQQHMQQLMTSSPAWQQHQQQLLSGGTSPVAPVPATAGGIQPWHSLPAGSVTADVAPGHSLPRGGNIVQSASWHVTNSRSTVSSAPANVSENFYPDINGSSSGRHSGFLGAADARSFALSAGVTSSAAAASGSSGFDSDPTAAQQLRQQQQALQLQQQQRPSLDQSLLPDSIPESGAAPNSALSSGPLAPPLLSKSSSKGSWLSRRLRKQGSDASDVVPDDAASMSSTGSGTSKRSGKSVLGFMKNLSYTMVYEDDKC